MKSIKKLTTIWLFTFVCSSMLFGAGARFEKPISLQIKNLTRWKNSGEASAIQQSLRAIIKPRQNYLRSQKILEEFRPYNFIFQKPFLLLEAEDNGFGGFFALVVFKGHSKVLRLWIYEIATDVFELREVVPLRVILNKQIMTEFADKRIASFWSSSLP